jgi:hypothetical protein
VSEQGPGVVVSRSQQLSAVLELLKSRRVAVQATTGPDGRPQAAIVAYVMGEGFELLFDALGSSRKVRNLRANPAVALVIGGFAPGDKRTVQYEGLADEPAGDERRRIERVHFGRTPGDAGPASWPDLVYVRVRPTWIRLGDFDATPPTIVEFAAAELGSR